MQTQLLTRPEAAKALRISIRKLASGELRATRSGGRVLIVDAVIEGFVQARTRETIG